MGARGQQPSLYGSRWQRYRVRFLRANPLCVYCGQQGRVTEATIVDHIIPHRGDYVLFWTPTNHQSLCQPCHDGAKRSEELGRGKGSDAAGMPIGNPMHPWIAQPARAVAGGGDDNGTGKG